MSPDAFERQNELVQASIIFSMLHIEDFGDELAVDFSRSEMDKALRFYQKRKPFKNNKKIAQK